MDEKVLLLKGIFPSMDDVLIRDTLVGLNGAVDDAAVLLSQMGLTEDKAPAALDEQKTPSKSASSATPSPQAKFVFSPPPDSPASKSFEASPVKFGSFTPQSGGKNVVSPAGTLFKISFLLSDPLIISHRAQPRMRCFSEILQPSKAAPPKRVLLPQNTHLVTYCRSTRNRSRVNPHQGLTQEVPLL